MKIVTESTEAVTAGPIKNKSGWEVVKPCMTNQHLEFIIVGKRKMNGCMVPKPALTSPIFRSVEVVLMTMLGE